MSRNVFLVMFFSAAILAMAQQPLTSPARRVSEVNGQLRNYLEMDYRGARLTPEQDKKLLALTTWKSDPDWQAVTVTSRYDIGDVRLSGLKRGMAEVNYVVLGRFTPGIGYTAEQDSESVEFTLSDESGSWKIMEAEPPVAPHVSRQALLQWLKASLPKEQDATKKAAMQSAITQLDKLSQDKTGH